MLEIREILCPIDFSETSRHALQHAVVIAKWFDARITALHVIHRPLFPQPPILGFGFVDSLPSASPNYRAGEQELHTWLEPARQAGLRTEAMVAEGDTIQRILEHAQSGQASLITIGTHGLSGFEHFMLGSVAEKILRKATCPVMTVPPAVKTAARVPYKRLLCPVDFSDSSLAALRLAFSLAEEADADLTILHVFDWPPDSELIVERFDEPEFRKVIEERAHRRLDSLVTDDVREWCRPATKVAYGRPYRAILDIAEREGADLIVMGVHGRNPLDLAVFGSTTNHVVRRAPCPVLTLKK
jgi:nucleotide-binding universal stress UspA family protein